MNRIKYYLVLTAILLMNQYGFAQTPEKDTVLNNYLKMAAQNNAGIKASLNQYLAALERVPQVGALPDPQGAMSFFLKPMELVNGNQIGSVSVMQMFPWFGTLKYAKDEASLMAKAKFSQFEESKAELFYNVKASWYILNRYDREIALIQKNISLLESLEKLALVRFQSPGGNSRPSGGSGQGSQKMEQNNGGSGGMGMNKQPDVQKRPQSNSSMSSGADGGMGSKQSGLSDVLRARMEILDQKNQLALLKDRRRTEEANFNSLLNREQNSEVVIADTLEMELLPVPILSVEDSIIERNPMLGMLEAEGRSYEAMGKKARKMGLPMLGLGLNYMVIQEQQGNASMMNGKDMVMPMVNFTIPIYRKKYKAMQKEAELLEESTRHKSADLKNSLLVQYRQFVQDLSDAERRVDLNREQAELASRTTDLLIAGFTSGSTDFEEVLRMQYKVLDYGYKDIEAVTDFNTAVAKAERLMNSVSY